MGTLIAIMGFGSTEIMDSLDQRGAESETNPEGKFAFFKELRLKSEEALLRTQNLVRAYEQGLPLDLLNASRRGESIE